MDNEEIIENLYKNTQTDVTVLQDPGIAHVVVDHNTVLSSRLVPGLHVDVKELEDGIDADITVDKEVNIENRVHLCFGMLAETGVQRIIMRVALEKNAKVGLLAHCVFPNAVDVKHIMDAVITVDDGADYTYFERHIHGPHGGIGVYPKAAVTLGKHARFTSEFELVKGRVGLVDMDYETICGEYSVLEMTARLSGSGDDVIRIRETGNLAGEYARGVLTTKIAVRDTARAEIYNKMTAAAAYARGHVDCKEIVQGQATATAVPIVEVNHPKAHITHEAAIGSVDSKQLQTLMSRGLTEDEAVALIIDGLLL
jgi:Fe-S cluster assembly scaffold protein SufB